MGIRFYCPNCGRRLNVKSFLSGKRGICPHCESRFEIPAESQIPKGAPKYRPTTDSEPHVPESPDESGILATQIATEDPVGPTAAVVAADPVAEAPDSVWYVRPPSGGQFGPARGEVLKQWISEGRVSADSMVWREGWEDWKAAGPLFPDLKNNDHSAAVEPETASLEPAPKSLSDLNKLDTQIEAETTYRRPRSSTPSGKSIAIVVVLGLLIVALLVALVLVLGN